MVATALFGPLNPMYNTSMIFVCFMFGCAELGQEQVLRSNWYILKILALCRSFTYNKEALEEGT